MNQRWGKTPRRINNPIPATNSGTPDHKVRMAGFEPAISCSRSTRNSRLSYILIKSVQRELNPRFLHGKQVGYRYIMGANKRASDCQTARAPGGTRTLVAALRVRYPRHWTTSAFVSVGPEGLEPSLGGLRVCCAAADHAAHRARLDPIPYSQHQSARRESNPRPDPYKRSALTVELHAAKCE